MRGRVPSAALNRGDPFIVAEIDGDDSGRFDLSGYNMTTRSCSLARSGPRDGRKPTDKRGS
ncbi:hypothetical protein D8S78_13305 [Natrialba swarupiae]|nr:hypothetical protein [Natrialba swarupiae]